VLETPQETQPESGTGRNASALSHVVERVLGESRYSAVRGVVCDEFGDVIRLAGQVPSHYLKQVAFAAVCQAVGSRPVINEIQVVNDAGRAPEGAATRSAASGFFRVGRGTPARRDRDESESTTIET